MAKNLRAALAGRTIDRPTFDASPVLARPGERAMPGALLVERRRVQPDPDQPRKLFDEAKIQELADSIREVGILQPLRVRTGPDGIYTIVNGERRWRAAGLADVNEVPVVVRDSPADQLAFEMLVENLQRENLSDEEEAAAYEALIGQGYGVNEIARRLGVDKGVISRKVRVYQESDLAAAVKDHIVSPGQAQELLPVKSAQDREQVIREVASRRAAGREVRNDDIRRLAREAPSFRSRFQGRGSDGVVAHNEEGRGIGVVGHNTAQVKSPGSNPHLGIDRAVKNVIDKLYALPGHYPDTAMSREVAAALDEAWRAVQEWRTRTGAFE